MRPLIRCHPLLRPLRSQRGASHPLTQPRQFHSSPRQQFPAELFELSHTITQYLHTISDTSWAASLFLTGALWRLAWCPVQSVISYNQNKSITIRPLQRAWRQVIVKQASHRFVPTPGVADTAGAWVNSEYRKADERLHVTHGIKSYLQIISNLLFLPIFIVNAEVVRRMAGQTAGITTFLRNNNIDPGDVPPELGLTQEGFLWIDTLSAGDPYWILPMIYCCTQYIYIWKTTEGGKLDETIRIAEITGNIPAKAQGEMLRLLRDGLTPVLPVMLIYWGIPSGTVLFMLGSTLGQMLSRSTVERLLPKPKVIEPAMARVPALRKSVKNQGRGLSMDDYTGKQGLLPPFKSSIRG